jgi:hypothetical protein
MHSQVEPLIGFFVSTTVFRHRFSNSMTFEELLVATRENTKKTFANQDIPFETLIDRLNIERSLSYAPLFQVVLSLQNVDTFELELPGLVVDQVDSKESVIKYDLELAVNEINDELWVNWDYDTGLFSEASVQFMADLFGVIIGELLTHSSQPLEQINFLAKMPQDKVNQWNEKRNRQIENQGAVFDPRLAEQRIESLEWVNEAFFYKQQVNGVPELFLYIQPAVESDAIETNVKQFMEQEFADYIAAATIVQVEAFPRHKDQSIDTGQLPLYKKQVEETLDNTTDSKDQLLNARGDKQNDLEITLSLLWQELLDKSAIGTDDNFFDLGGNSLLAIRLVDAANKKGVPLQLGHLWKYQSFGPIVEVLQKDFAISKHADSQLAQESERISLDDKAVIPVTKPGHLCCRTVVATDFTETHLRHAIKKIDAKFGVLGSELLLVEDSLYIEQNKTNIKRLKKLVVVVDDVDGEHERDAIITKAADDFNTSLEFSGNMTCRVLFIGNEEKKECVLLCHQNLFTPEQWRAVSELFKTLCANVAVA